MKTLFAFLLFASTSHAASFAKIDELRANQVKTVYTSQEFCGADCLQIDDFDLETVDVVEIKKPVTHCETNEQGEELCQVVGEEPTGSFELKESKQKKKAKEDKAKADGLIKETKRQQKLTQLQTVKNLSNKSLTLGEQKIALEALLKLFAESEGDLSETLLRISAQQQQPTKDK